MSLFSSLEIDQRLFENALLHGLTLSWIPPQAKIDWDSYLPSSLTQEATWLTFLLSQEGTRQEAGHITSEEKLGEKTMATVEQKVCLIQAYVLKHLLEQQASLNFIKKLEHLSLKQGTKEWENLGTGLEETPLSFLTAFQKTPFGSYRQDSFLLQRLTSQECRFQLKKCPHQHPETQDFSPSLQETWCALQTAWIEGFGKKCWSPGSLKKLKKKPHCTFVWSRE